MTAPLDVPGFSGDQFLDPQAVAFWESDPSILKPPGTQEPERTHHAKEILAASALALGAAIYVLRHHIADTLLHRDPQLPATPAALDAFEEHRSLWLRLAVPIISQVMGASAPQLGESDVTDIAHRYVNELGDYLKATNAQAFDAGFSQQLQAKQPDRLAWLRSTQSYGLESRTMFSYIAGVLAADEKKAMPVPQREATMAARREKLLAQRSEHIGDNETWRAAQIAKSLAWVILAHKGLLPKNAMIMWDTHEDERTCHECGPMHGQLIKPGHFFITADGKRALTPPLHPGCRCELRLRVSVETPVTKNFNADERRDNNGRWTAAPALARALPRDEPEPSTGLPVFKRPARSPLTAFQRVSPVPTPRAPLETFQRPQPLQAFSRATPLPTFKRVTTQRPETATAPAGKLIPLPPIAQPEQKIAPKPAPHAQAKPSYLVWGRLPDDDSVFTGPTQEAIPGATITFGTRDPYNPDHVGPNGEFINRERVQVQDHKPHPGELRISHSNNDFWEDAADDLAVLHRAADEHADALVAYGSDDAGLADEEIRNIYRLAGKPSGGTDAQLRRKLLDEIDKHPSGSLASAYRDYATYAAPDVTSWAADEGNGEQLAHIIYETGAPNYTGSHGAVPIVEVVTFDGYAPGDSPDKGIAGEYEITNVTYRSNGVDEEGVPLTPGTAGVRYIHVRPTISKRIGPPRLDSAFGVDHTAAHLSSEASDA